jgi:hypothetical protein
MDQFAANFQLLATTSELHGFWVFQQVGNAIILNLIFISIYCKQTLLKSRNRKVAAGMSTQEYHQCSPFIH